MFVGSTAWFWFIFPPAFALIRDRTHERRGAFLPGLAGYVGMLFLIARVCFYVPSLMLFSQHKLSVSVYFCLYPNFPRGQPSARVHHKLDVRVHVERPRTPGVILFLISLLRGLRISVVEETEWMRFRPLSSLTANCLIYHSLHNLQPFKANDVVFSLLYPLAHCRELRNSWPAAQSSKSVLFTRTFCRDGNVHYLCCQRCILSTWKLARGTKKLIFKFYLILIDLNLSEELTLLNRGVGEDSWESFGLQGNPTSQS